MAISKDGNWEIDANGKIFHLPCNRFPGQTANNRTYEAYSPTDAAMANSQVSFSYGDSPMESTKDWDKRVSDAKTAPVEPVSCYKCKELFIGSKTTAPGELNG